MIWYNCAFCAQIRILIKTFFFFHFIFILSYSRAICSREECVYTIHQFFIIKIYINKISFFYFFFFFIFLFEIMFVNAKKVFLVYYKIEIFFVYYETFVDWLYVDSESFMTSLTFRWKCVMNALYFHFTFYYFYFWSFSFKNYCCFLK